MKGELLGLHVSEDVAIPRIICGNGEQVFIRKIIINRRIIRTGR